MAQKDKVDWLLHVDTDEMIYPSGSPAFSLQVRRRQAGMPCRGAPGARCGAAAAQAAAGLWLLRTCCDTRMPCCRCLLDHCPLLTARPQEVLGKVPADVDTLVFPNYESLPERDDVADPFLEVSLFKKNYAHVVSGAGGGTWSLLRDGAPDVGRLMGRLPAPPATPGPDCRLLSLGLHALRYCRPVLQGLRHGGPRQPKLLYHLWQRQIR